jgi:Fungal rhodopsin domain
MSFLLRLTGQKQAVKWAIWALLSVTVILAILHASLLIFQCTPIAAMWDKTIPNAKCLNFSTVLTVFSSFAVVTDAIALMIPTWIVYDLHIDIKQKLMLIGILSFGLM